MVRLIDVSKSYENGARALRNVSIRIDDGEFVLLVGPSGSGKSTIVKLITAEIAPTEGRCGSSSSPISLNPADREPGSDGAANRGIRRALEKHLDVIGRRRRLDNRAGTD